MAGIIGSGGDVAIAGPQANLDSIGGGQSQNLSSNLAGDSLVDDWSREVPIRGVLKKLSDVDELSLRSFYVGDDNVPLPQRGDRRVTVNKPITQLASTVAPISATDRSLGAADLNAPASQRGAGEGTNAGPASTGAGEANAGVSSEQAQPVTAAANGTLGWIWWLGGAVSGGSVGTLTWIYRRSWRRGGKRPGQPPDA